MTSSYERDEYRFHLKRRAVTMDSPARASNRAAAAWCLENGNPMHWTPEQAAAENMRRASLELGPQS